MQKVSLGGGTPEDPFKIYTAEQLFKVAQLVNSGNSTYESASYIQMNDIDISTICADSGWSTINTFSGIYDGGGKAIDGFTSDGGYGLFNINYGTIKNVRMTNVNVHDGLGGALVNSNQGTVAFCSFDGEFTVYGLPYIGALISSSATDTSQIIGCSFNGIYKSSIVYTGALIGLVHQGLVIGCYSTGQIVGLEGNSEISGVTGDTSNDASVYACYTTADFTINSKAFPIGCFYGGATNTSSYHAAVSDKDFLSDESVFIDGNSVTWTTAVAAMNTAMKEAGYDYEYIENTDEATKDAFPYVLVEI